MNLQPIYKETHAADILWSLLEERRPDESISHKHMPTRAEHEHFVANHPYRAWYLIEEDVAIPGFLGHAFVGAIYLTKQREVGIGILKAFRGHGHARNAIQMLIDKYGKEGPMLANINPHNSKSSRLFHGLGFRLIQVTYALEVA